MFVALPLSNSTTHPPTRRQNEVHLNPLTTDSHFTQIINAQDTIIIFNFVPYCCFVLPSQSFLIHLSTPSSRVHTDSSTPEKAELTSRNLRSSPIPIPCANHECMRIREETSHLMYNPGEPETEKPENPSHAKSNGRRIEGEKGMT